MPADTKNPAADKMQRLIALMISRTEDQSAQWSDTADENTFRLASPSANIRITKDEGFDHENECEYVNRSLEILNERGRLIEEYVPQGKTEEGDFDKLFVLARRSAYKTDKVLDALIDEFAEDIPF